MKVLPTYIIWVWTDMDVHCNNCKVIIVFTFTRTKCMKNEVSALFRLIVLSYRHVLNETNEKSFSQKGQPSYIWPITVTCVHTAVYIVRATKFQYLSSLYLPVF